MTFGQLIEQIFSSHITSSDVLIIVEVIGCILISGLMVSSTLSRPLLWALAGVIFGMTIKSVWNVELISAIGVLLFEIIILLLPVAIKIYQKDKMQHRY